MKEQDPGIGRADAGRTDESDKITRLEVIDCTKSSKFGGGRVFVAWDDTIVLEGALQDDDRTLKIFLKDR